MSADDRRFLDEALRLAEANVMRGGGPFGAVVVRDGEIVARGTNRVTAANDPTAHAEIEALRAACRVLDSFQLDGCVIYSSCEPCPMCLGAIHWARPDRLVWAATREDAARAGFDDSHIYTQIALDPTERSLPQQRVDHPRAQRPFEVWTAQENRVEY